jgi:hypothetical protein
VGALHGQVYVLLIGKRQKKAQYDINASHCHLSIVATITMFSVSKAPPPTHMHPIHKHPTDTHNHPPPIPAGLQSLCSAVPQP